MQLVVFGPEREWWVPGRVWDRLFQSVEATPPPDEVLYWFRVTDANNGIDLDEDLEPELRPGFVATIRQAAQRELALVGDVDPQDGEDGMYRSALERLLELIANDDEGRQANQSAE
jgi:hypothetical protein